MAQASERQIFTRSLEASEDLSDYQYHGVVMSADQKVDLFDGATDIPVGVLLNDPESGQQALVGVIGEYPVVLGETVTAGQLLRFDASTGHAMAFEVDTDTTAYCAGQFLQGGDSGEVVMALINAVNPYRGEE